MVYIERFNIQPKSTANECNAMTQGMAYPDCQFSAVGIALNRIKHRSKELL